MKIKWRERNRGRSTYSLLICIFFIVWNAAPLIYSPPRWRKPLIVERHQGPDKGKLGIHIPSGGKITFVGIYSSDDHLLKLGSAEETKECTTNGRCLFQLPSEHAGKRFYVRYEVFGKPYGYGFTLKNNFDGTACIPDPPNEVGI